MGPGTYFKMILGPVAPFSQSMSPWRATATHFVTTTIISGPPQNTNICYQTPKILILGPCMYCKQRIMCCICKMMSQRSKLYVANIQYVCCKYIIIFRRCTIGMLKINILFVANTHILSLSNIDIYVYYIHRIGII